MLLKTKQRCDKINYIYLGWVSVNKINILAFDKLDSTSTYAKENAASLPLPSIITANHQTAGRGRRGNSFYSPENTGLYMTVIFEAPENCELLTPKAAVAVCKVLENHGIFPKIKWVNDLFYNSKKVCGILAERFIIEGKAVVSVGIGINLKTESFPDELSIAGSINLECDKTSLAQEIALGLISDTDSEEIISEYRKRLFILGRNIFYSENGQIYSAVATDISKNCNLIVKLSDGSFKALSSGEISIKI